MSKTEQERNRIISEFEKIQLDDFADIKNIQNYLAKKDDIPDLGTIELYDYDSEIDIALKQSKNVIESLVDLYLGDAPNLKNSEYIKNKMNDDAVAYAEAIFLNKMTRKNFIGQLKQIDNGDNSARMHEVVNQTISQIRENIKFMSIQRTELEKFYKNLRKDFGLDNINNPDIKSNNDENMNQNNNEDDLLKMDNKKLNELIKNYLNKNNEPD